MTDTRQPAETPTPRMENLARLPVFFALAGKRVLVAGGSSMAAWKVELLSATGANVDVVAAEVSDDMRSVARDAPRGPVTLHERAWRIADLFGAAMAIGDFSNEGEASRFAAAARSHGVPVNVVDKPKFCDFSFGAIVNRSPLVIGISTDGAAPVFGQAIRAKLEAMLPQGFCRLGGGRAALARGSQELRPVVRSAPPVLATLHDAGHSQSCTRAVRLRLCRVARGNA